MFEPGFHTSAPAGAPSLLVRVRGDLVAVEDGPYPAHGHFLGTLDGLPCVAVEEGTDADDSFVGLRQLWGLVEEPVWAIAGRAVQIVAWDRRTCFADVVVSPQSCWPTNAPGGARSATSQSTPASPRQS